MPSRALRSVCFVPACGAALFAALAAPGIARADEPPSAAPSSAPASPAPPGASTSAAAAPPGTTAAITVPSDPAAGKPPRPPPLPPTPSVSVPWERLLDVGGDFLIIARPATGDAQGRPSGVRYQPATGFGLRLRWPLLTHLHVEAYYTDCHMPVTIPQGALGPTDTITSPPVETYAIGARVSPRLVWGRLSAWVTAGAGWGRLEVSRMTATTPSGAAYTVRERSGSFVELPLGVGVSWEIVPRWISIDLQSTAAFVVGQRGNAFEAFQAVDATGHARNIGPLPVMDASLLQTIGLSLLL